MKILSLFAMAILICLVSSINVPLCSNAAISFLLKDTQGVSDSSTRASLCHDKKSLFVSWDNIDSQIISTYTKCNDPLYKEDVVQIFIASPKSYPVNYWEIEVSPKGVLFFSDITNPSGNCSKFTGAPRDCGLISGSGKILSKGWEAHLTVPLNIVEKNEGGNQFYANIFRIDYSTGKATKYLAMNPTGTPTPCFHVPNKFQKFVLMGMNSTNLSTD